VHFSSCGVSVAGFLADLAWYVTLLMRSDVNLVSPRPGGPNGDDVLLFSHRCGERCELGLMWYAGLALMLVGEGGLGCVEQQGTRTDSEAKRQSIHRFYRFPSRRAGFCTSFLAAPACSTSLSPDRLSMG
jgi:hypothetical protein